MFTLLYVFKVVNLKVKSLYHLVPPLHLFQLKECSKLSLCSRILRERQKTV